MSLIRASRRCEWESEADQGRRQDSGGSRGDSVGMHAGDPRHLPGAEPVWVRQQDGLHAAVQRARAAPQHAPAGIAAADPRQEPRRQAHLRRLLRPRHGDGPVTPQLRSVYFCSYLLHSVASPQDFAAS